MERTKKEYLPLPGYETQEKKRKREKNLKLLHKKFKLFF